MPPTSSTDRERWISHLQAVTGGLLEGVPFEASEAARVRYVEGFQDEFGNRRASDRAFLAHLLRAPMTPLRPVGDMGLDERLWWHVADGSALPEGLVAGRDGLLVEPDAFAIEYRTMIELSALHAFWSVALRENDPAMRIRALDAARWHVEELQPDNAINRPWGLAVFVELAIEEQDEMLAQTAELHAQTLLHNACINFGKPDLLSALILRDATEQLRSAAQ
ncbi:MAG: hypothetical protein ACX94C_05425 [Phycisphaerales bacterium]